LVSGGGDSGAVEKKSGRNEGRKNMRIHRNKKGFTLIELIVVIAILAILAAILVPTISGFIGRANDATDIANAKMLYNSGMMVLAEGGSGTFTSSSDPISDYVTAWPVVKNPTSNGHFFRVTVNATSVVVATYTAATGGTVEKTFNQSTGAFT
jgi:type IV pilus assembly protein PilA